MSTLAGQFRNWEGRQGMQHSDFAEAAFVAWQRSRGNMSGARAAIDVCDQALALPESDRQRVLFEKAGYLRWLAKEAQDPPNQGTIAMVLDAVNQALVCYEDALDLTPPGVWADTVRLCAAWTRLERAGVRETVAIAYAAAGDTAAARREFAAAQLDRDLIAATLDDLPAAWAAGRRRGDFTSWDDFHQAQAFSRTREGLEAWLRPPLQPSAHLAQLI